MLTSVQDMNDEQKKLVEQVMNRFHEAQKWQRQYHPQWENLYGLWRSYRKLKKEHAGIATQRGRDELIRQYQSDSESFELFIPQAFAVVETVLPRILSNDPRMLVLPLDQPAEESAEPVKRLFERDQAAINYDIKLQGPARSGLIYGLGGQKNFWEKLYRQGRTRKHLWGNVFFTKKGQRLIHDGPQAEPVDIWDLFWDPAGFDVKSCDYMIHRTWRSARYIMDKVASGQWEEMSGELVNSLGTDNGRGEMWQPRWEAAGIGSYSAEGSNRLHEVLEYHDRDKVVTILDKQVLVQEMENPFNHGDLPFSIFRPTLAPNEFVGIGEIEPIAHLQAELNDLRTLRRDQARAAMGAGFFYSRGMIDPADMENVNARSYVPVLGDPADVVKPMPFHEIPSSSVTEEEAIKSDMERATGISEAVAGTGQVASSTTATGTQLVQQAAEGRIKQKGKNLAKELIRPAAAQWLELYRQHVSGSQDVRVDTPSGYHWVKVKPKDVAANLEIVPEAGATEPENPAQKQQTFMNMIQALAPFAEQLDQGELLKRGLEMFGVPHPDKLIKEPEPEGQEVVQVIGDYLAEAGVPPEIIHAAAKATLDDLMGNPETGPAPEEQPQPVAA
jgi:hypothetical protein